MYMLAETPQSEPLSLASPHLDYTSYLGWSGLYRSRAEFETCALCVPPALV